MKMKQRLPGWVTGSAAWLEDKFKNLNMVAAENPKFPHPDTGIFTIRCSMEKMHSRLTLSSESFSAESGV